MNGEVIKLDRKFPLVKCENGTICRCEEAANIKKESDIRCVIGDHVVVSLTEGHEFGVIEEILLRKTEFVRKDPSERSSSQILAANFTQVVIVEPFDRINIKRIERELVLAHETGAKVAILLTKFDTVEPDRRASLTQEVSDIAGKDVKIFEVSVTDPLSIEGLKDTLFLDEASILLGQSGAGKSTLINKLLGENFQATGEVREGDSKGRHTTVSRSIIDISVPEGHWCQIVDMPGVRGLGLWDSRNGIDLAFKDISKLAQECKFRDCKHISEPGCAVMKAVQDGKISQARLSSYIELNEEINSMLERRERSTWKNK